VSFPAFIVPDLRVHLDALDETAALVFTSPDGDSLRHSNFYRRAWMPALIATGLAGIHFHDLRHTGNQLTADEGASLRELMDRMGRRSAIDALCSSSVRDETSRPSAFLKSGRSVVRPAPDHQFCCGRRGSDQGICALSLRRTGLLFVRW
jgi:hypothetical protein